MNKSTLKKLMKELIWLLAIIGIAGLLEYLIFEIFDLHPVIKIKLQVLAGLVVIGYAIRVINRIWKSFYSSDESPKNTDALDEF